MAWMTPKIDWTAADYYNFEDLNRVENNTEHIKELLKLLEYDISLVIEKNRDMAKIEFADSLNRIEENINTIKVYEPKGWIAPKTNWKSDEAFDYGDANRLEINLLHLFLYAKGNVDNFRYAGAYTCGEEVI